MKRKNWHVELQELLGRQQRSVFYNMLYRVRGPGLDGLARLLRDGPPVMRVVAGNPVVRETKPLPEESRSSLDKPTWDQATEVAPLHDREAVQDKENTIRSADPRSPTIAVPSFVPSQSKHPSLSLATAWCAVSRLDIFAEWLEKLSSADEVTNRQVCEMHQIVTCLRLSGDSTRAMLTTSREFTGEQVVSICVEASRLFYGLVYKLQERDRFNEISARSISAQARKFSAWIENEVASTSFSWIRGRLVVHDAGSFDSTSHDFEPGHSGQQIRPLTFQILKGPPDEQGIRARVISAPKASSQRTGGRL